ncbi:MAG: lysophospholipid acyltransferase family protein [Bacteroidota bacterium]|nr:lysophospholipid acyltransferase family protein [Bacteroidota bacterium]MDP3144698.1 lysophospholipid acyltransferase family protein [Bacteroidota bacterium]MDP3557929.1 lysophospholipid acyltransferase family protein [Bacteroidota bacterium]
MGKWSFKIFVFPLLYFISILPFWILYPLSNFFYFIIFYIVGYRKKVVIQNLKNSFPEKSEKEIDLITKQFYRHFCDVIFETIKLYTISKEKLNQRCTFSDEAVKTLNIFFDKGQSIVGVIGHMGNWEWGAILHQVYFKQLITGVYHPLSNKSFDAFMLKLRSRFGGNIVSMSALYKEILTLRQKKIPTTIGLIADQTPPPENAYWTTFLNQDTPVFVGTEKLAKKFNYPVVYLPIIKLKRGYYQLGAIVITENPKDLADGEISRLHTLALEKNIQQQPAFWLWSHRRWKHKRPIKA